MHQSDQWQGVRAARLDNDTIPGSTIAGDTRALWILIQVDRPITANDLGDILECDRENASQALQRLHEKEFLTRTDIGRIRRVRYEYEVAGPGDTCGCRTCRD